MSRTNISYYAILGILGFGSMTGYGIKAWVNDGVGYFVDIDYKQIYPTLKLMVEDGLVTYITKETRNRLRSKTYTITEKGLAELKSWLNKPIKEGKQSAGELKLKLFFGHHLPLEKSLEHLNRFKDSNLRMLQTLEEIKGYFEKDDVKDASWHYRFTTVMNGEIICKANIDWCNQTIEHLNASVAKKASDK